MKVRRIVVAVGLIVLMPAVFVAFSSTDASDVNAPVFKLLSVHRSYVQDGVDIEFTFKNVGHPATEATVLLPWERVAYNAPLSGVFHMGNITEATLGLDVNGNNDTDDIFIIRYVDYAQVKVDGTTANATQIPEQTMSIEGGTVNVFDERNSFTLGTKTHILYNVWGLGDIYYATLGLDCFYRSHPSPHAVFIVEQAGSSINSTAKAEITSLKLNGTLTPCEFKWTLPYFLLVGGGRWYTEDVYNYPLGFIDSDAAFTVQLSIRGEPGSYILTTMLDWSPDTFHIYQYALDAATIPFTIMGTVEKELAVGEETFHVSILTNSTVSDRVVLNQTEKTLSFNATGHLGTIGVFNVTLPQNLLGYNSFSITIDGTPMKNFIQTTNETHTFLSFNLNYPQSEIIAFSTSSVIIKGTQQTPPLWTQWWLWAAVVAIVIIAVTALALLKRRLAQNEISSSPEVPRRANAS